MRHILVLSSFLLLTGALTVNVPNASAAFGDVITSNAPGPTAVRGGLIASAAVFPTLVGVFGGAISGGFVMGATLAVGVGALALGGGMLIAAASRATRGTYNDGSAVGNTMAGLAGLALGGGALALLPTLASSVTIGSGAAAVAPVLLVGAATAGTALVLAYGITRLHRGITANSAGTEVSRNTVTTAIDRAAAFAPAIEEYLHRGVGTRH